MIEKSTWHPKWHEADNVSWSTKYLVNLGASKSGGSNANLGLWQAIKLLQATRVIITPWWGRGLPMI